MKKTNVKSKITTIAIITILTISVMLVVLQTTAAQEPPRKKTYPFIGAIPNPVGVNQEVLLHVGITDATALTHIGWEGLTVTVTLPNGSTETLGPYTTDSTGGTGGVYVPTMIGTYTLQTHFPEQVNPVTVYMLGGPVVLAGTVMEASNSEIIELVVTQEPIEYYPDIPLPTEYWTRPIDAQLREWSTIAGNRPSAFHITSPVSASRQTNGAPRGLGSIGECSA